MGRLDCSLSLSYSRTSSTLHDLSHFPSKAKPSGEEQIESILAASCVKWKQGQQLEKDPRYHGSPLGTPGARWIVQSTRFFRSNQSQIVGHTLPRPISSAKMPLIPCSYNVASQLSPLSWYSFSCAINIFGCPIVKGPLSDVGFWKFSSSESTKILSVNSE